MLFLLHQNTALHCFVGFNNSFFGYLGIVRPCEIIPLSLRCLSSLSRVSRISLSTAVSVSSRGLRYNESSRPESSEVGDRVEDSVGSLAAGGWISL